VLDWNTYPDSGIDHVPFSAAAPAAPETDGTAGATSNSGIATAARFRCLPAADGGRLGACGCRTIRGGGNGSMKTTLTTSGCDGGASRNSSGLRNSAPIIPVRTMLAMPAPIRSRLSRPPSRSRCPPGRKTRSLMQGNLPSPTRWRRLLLLSCDCLRYCRRRECNARKASVSDVNACNFHACPSTSFCRCHVGGRVPFPGSAPSDFYGSALKRLGIRKLLKVQAAYLESAMIQPGAGRIFLRQRSWPRVLAHKCVGHACASMRAGERVCQRHEHAQQFALVVAAGNSRAQLPPRARCRW